MIGRFVTVDPVKDGLNWYAYAANNPLRYVDPNGLSPWDVLAGAATAYGESLINCFTLGAYSFAKAASSAVNEAVANPVRTLALVNAPTAAPAAILSTVDYIKNTVEAIDTAQLTILIFDKKYIC